MSCKHDWEPQVKWSGRYRCRRCGVFGHRARSSGQDVAKGIHADMIVAYKCQRCGRPARMKRKVGMRGKAWDCGEHADTATRRRDDLKCPECEAPMVLRSSKYGLFYGCTRYPDCKAAHGAHPDGAPLGTPADKPTKEARMRAHDAFDAFWKAKGWTRKQGYRWMETTMGLSRSDSHIAKFDVAKCERLIELIGADA